MLESLRTITTQAKQRLAQEREVSIQTSQLEEQTRLANRLEQIHAKTKSHAEKGEEWVEVARLDDSLGFWGRPERDITPNELPYGDERILAQTLAKEGFTIRAGWYDPFPYDMSDHGGMYNYWGISWRRKRSTKETTQDNP